MGPSPGHCRLVVPLLRKRDGRETTVLLSGARTLRVFNIAWGEDLGDHFEHITGNVSPSVEGASVDLFFTDEIASLADPGTGEVLWKADGASNVR